MATSSEPPPFQESIRCEVCNCSFTTFRRRYWKCLLTVSFLVEQVRERVAIGLRLLRKRRTRRIKTRWDAIEKILAFGEAKQFGYVLMHSLMCIYRGGQGS